MNSGSTPCTLQRGPLPDSGYKQALIPQLPSPKPVTEKFDKEILETLADARKQLDEVTNALMNANKPMSKKEQIELAKTLGGVRRDISGNISYVADQFSEHVERTVEKAKAEFNAFKMNHILKVGSQAIAGDSTELPTLQR